MKQQEKDIEQLFSSALGAGFEVEGSTTWEQLQERRRRDSFFRFNAKKINIFYLAMLSCAVAAASLSVKYEIFPRILGETQPAKTHPNIKHEKTSSITVEASQPVTQAEGESHDITAVAPAVNTPANYSKTTDEPVAGNNDNIAEPVELTTANTLVDNMTVDTLEEEEKAVEEFIPATNKKATKKVIVIQKQQVMVKDTVVKVVKKHVRQRE